MSLTTGCCVHSNVYGLGNVHWIRYLAVVDPIRSTSSAMHTYHHLISGSVKIPLLTTTAGNSSSIGKVPVPSGRHIWTLRRPATISEVSPAEQGIINIYTNVLQGHDTVVMVCCISEREPDITCTQEDWIFTSINVSYILSNFTISTCWQFGILLDS